MNSERMFIAIHADEVAGPVQQLQDRLAAADADVRWATPEQLHLTLKFLGETTLLHSAKVCRAMQRIAEQYASAELEIHGASAFPKVERPRTIWTGVRQGVEWLLQVQQDIDDAMADLHYLPETRYTPHVTIGRVKTPRNAAELHDQLIAESDANLGMIGATEMTLFTSRLEADGPVYETVGHVKFNGPAQADS